MATSSTNAGSLKAVQKSLLATESVDKTNKSELTSTEKNSDNPPPLEGEGTPEFDAQEKLIEAMCQTNMVRANKLVAIVEAAKIIKPFLNPHIEENTLMSILHSVTCQGSTDEISKFFEKLLEHIKNKTQTSKSIKK